MSLLSLTPKLVSRFHLPLSRAAICGEIKKHDLFRKAVGGRMIHICRYTLLPNGRIHNKGHGFHIVAAQFLPSIDTP